MKYKMPENTIKATIIDVDPIDEEIVIEFIPVEVTCMPSSRSYKRTSKIVIGYDRLTVIYDDNLSENFPITKYV